MKGKLVICSGKTAGELTRMKYYLIGRVAKIKIKRGYKYYFYPGIINDIKFKKLSPGCYFVATKDLTLDDDYVLFNVDLEITEKSLITPLDYFKEKYRDCKVQNID